MNYWQRPVDHSAAWDYLIETVHPHVALVQECRVPDGLEQVASSVLDPDPASKRHWGTALVVLDRELELQAIERAPVSPVVPDGAIEDSHPGASAVGTVVLPGGKAITCVSLYGVMEKASNGIKYATTSVHRMLSDLTPILDSRRSVILGGDWNISTQIERRYREGHRAVFTRLASFGLLDLLKETASDRAASPGCPCDEELCTHVQTHRHNRSDKPWHIDYLFTSRDLAAGARAWLDSSEESWSLSDHCPVITELELR
jgi:exonuclease III